MKEKMRNAKLQPGSLGMYMNEGFRVLSRQIGRSSVSIRSADSFSKNAQTFGEIRDSPLWEYYILYSYIPIFYIIYI